MSDIIDIARLHNADHNSAQRLSNVNAALDGRGVEEDTRATEAATQFSALLIEMMIKSMRKTIPHDSQGDGDGLDLRQEFFDDLLYQQYADIMASTNALGIRDIVSEALLR